jgi:hypothetical protein
MTNKTISLCFELEADEVDVFMLKRALRDEPGGPLWLRHYLGLALEQVVTNAQGGGVWRFEVKGGRVVEGSRSQ